MRRSEIEAAIEEYGPLPEGWRVVQDGWPGADENEWWFLDPRGSRCGNHPVDHAEQQRLIQEEVEAEFHPAVDGVKLLRALSKILPGKIEMSGFSMVLKGDVYEIRWTNITLLALLTAGLAAKWSVIREGDRLLVGVKA